MGSATVSVATFGVSSNASVFVLASLCLISVSRHACLASLWQKKPKIAKRTQFSMQAATNQKDTLKISPSRQFKPIQALAGYYAARRWSQPAARNSRVTPILTYYRLIPPDEGLFPEKKIVYFFAAPPLALDASVQINPN